MDPVHFMNVDLEIVAREPLDAVAADLGDDVFVMHCGPTERGYLASFEIPGNSADADTTVGHLCFLIESLGDEARALWNRARGRSFDLGYESGSCPRFVSTLRAETVKRVAALEAEIVITIYPAIL
jgi:hypothetical protein